jgi:hypothetical protein
MQCTASFLELLSECRCVFTQPSFQSFLYLMTGRVFSSRRRFVTELVFSSDSTHRGHHSRYHNFFAKSVWAPDTLSRVLAQILVAVFAPSGILALAVDDTLCRKRGLTKGRKKAKKSPKPRPDPNHRTRPQLAVELISLVAGWFPERQLLVSGDSAYGGASVLRPLPANVDLISHVHPKGVLYEPAPASSGKGRPAKKGPRLPGMKDWAADPAQPWRTLTFNQFGLHATLKIKTRKALYYTAGKDRLLTIVLVRDAVGHRHVRSHKGRNLNSVRAACQGLPQQHAADAQGHRVRSDDSRQTGNNRPDGYACPALSLRSDQPGESDRPHTHWNPLFPAASNPRSNLSQSPESPTGPPKAASPTPP